ncbi:hypothetical protein FISHEDRAFT_34563 [Fistulina hepatica ATCC 64428]|uniref:S-adenosyl-L-methionine-dependent methyltransferase n=1 Tax=Fistulina hepatica ATCC 64428 TaxID=1128425 RepID=A0A0D7AMI9_9AGAR|nr:hypothetical protein FISHEDRAFT_34563 [Fistulina hepatica ATCC 64428]
MAIPPSACLPPIKTIASQSCLVLHDCLSYLRQIYTPPVRGSKRRDIHIPLPILNDQGVYDEWRSDAFEKAYSIRWLTVLISQMDKGDVDAERSELIQTAASLLAACAGTASAGTVVRDYSFFTPVCGTDAVNVKVKDGLHEVCASLTDIALDNDDFSSVGAQTWGGACVLAEAIALHPEHFGLTRDTTVDDASRRLRILELGAGTGLVSIVAAKVLQLQGAAAHCPGACVVATDFYPSVLANLDKNIRANFAGSETDSTRIDISAHFLDWSLFPIDPSPAAPLDDPFDIVLGADIVYESEHAAWIRSCLERLLARPAKAAYTQRDPRFHLVIPLRPFFAAESNSIECVFPSIQDCRPGELTIYAKETIVCDADDVDGGQAEVVYAYYQIGWA